MFATSRCRRSSTGRRAIAAGAPLVWPAATGNIAVRMRHGDAGRDGGRVREGRACRRARPRQPARRAVPDGAARDARALRCRQTDRLTLRRQQPDADRACATRCATRCSGIPKEKVRVLVGDVGGGFGMKTGLYPEDVVAGLRRARSSSGRCNGRPSASRNSSPPRTAATSTSKAELALDANGKRARAARATRSPTSAPTPAPAGVVIQLLIGPWVSTSIYDIRHDRLRIQGGAHQHRADRRLSRRRPARGDLHHRAADRRRRAPDRHRPGRAAPPQPDPARADAVHERDGARPTTAATSTSILDQALALADWNGLRGARGRIARTRGPPARSRARHVPRMDRRQRLRGARHGHRRRRRRDRDLLRDAGDGAGPRDDLRAARRRRLRRAASRRSASSRATPTAAPASAAPARARCSSAARRCTSPPSATVAKAQELAAEALEAAAGDIEYRDGVFRIAGTDRAIGLFELARKQPRARASCSIRRARSPARPGPTAATSAKSRSIRKPAQSRSPRTGRSTTSAASSTR